MWPRYFTADHNILWSAPAILLGGKAGLTVSQGESSVNKKLQETSRALLPSQVVTVEGSAEGKPL
jgi:hypothetical protein